jgi:hypothetical protein
MRLRKQMGSEYELFSSLKEVYSLLASLFVAPLFLDFKEVS